MTTGAGRVTRYTAEPTAGGGVHRTVRTPSGAVTTCCIDRDGTRTLTLPSGETRHDADVGPALRRGRVARARTGRSPRRRARASGDYAYGATLGAGDPFDADALTARR